MKKTISLLVNFLVLSLAVLILKNPEICAKSAVSGLLLCGNVVIPSLFPFTFCVLFILKSGVTQKLKIPKTVSVFLLSLIGGYPLGAKMLSSSDIDSKTASRMLCFCVNAGPAFIILAVGNGIFASRKIGIILFVAHILPSLILAFLSRKAFKFTQNRKCENTHLIDNFVLSATESAATLINISSFVILFSVVSAYLTEFSVSMPFLKTIAMLTEVTNGVFKTTNVYTISALLGFGGISIWCQVFSLAKDIKINYLHFILCRFFHAISSAAFTYSLIKLFKITLPALSNNISFTFSPVASTVTVGISMLIMGIVFIISLVGRNFAGNILEDIV